MKPEDMPEIYLKTYQAVTKTLNELSDEIEHLTPAQTDLYRTQLAALYSLMSEELSEIEKKKAFYWLELKEKDDSGSPRKKPLSDKATDTLFDCSEIGQRRIELKYKTRSAEKMISALASHLRRMSEEARNNF